MFSYKDFITGYLQGTKVHKDSNPRGKAPQMLSKPQGSTHEILINSLDFSTMKPSEVPFIHSPRVPQLPSLSTPRKIKNTRRPLSTDRTEQSEKDNIFINPTPKPRPYTISIEEIKPPEFKTLGLTSLKVSLLNTSYRSNQPYIMDNLEKAKKYFPIPLGRKQLRTTSMSISHTPMSRLYSPQNFSKRGNFSKATSPVNDSEQSHDVDEIEIQGKAAERKSFKRNFKILPHMDLYDILFTFFHKTELFSKRFEEIDKTGKGYLLLSDIRNIKGCEEKSVAEGVFHMLRNISKRTKVGKSEFLAACAVYQHNGGEPHGFSLADSSMIAILAKQIEELRHIFMAHANGDKIAKKYMLEISEFLKAKEDMLKAESFVLTQRIDFPWFLRCIPYFLFIHIELLNKSFH